MNIAEQDPNPEWLSNQLELARVVLALQLAAKEDEPLYRTYLDTKEREWSASLEHLQEKKQQMQKEEASDLDLFIFSKEISQGERGLGVAELQKALTLCGYDLGQDGIFGPQTKEVLTRFQHDQGLAASGRLDKQTAEHINRVLNQRGITEPVGINVDQPPTPGYWVAVDKSHNLLILFKGERAIDDYPVATGKSPSLTPEGQFKIIFKAVNPAWGGAGIASPVPGGHPDNPLGSRWLGLDIGGGGTYGLHGTNNPASIGSYASLGCIRLHNQDVEYLYELLPEHTPVWIGNTHQLESWGIRY